MTIVNVWLERDRALVCADSHCLEDHAGDLGTAKARGGACKLVALPHVGSVLAVQGNLGLLVNLLPLLVGKALDDFDSIEAQMPKACWLSLGLLLEQRKSQEIEQDVGLQRIVHVGYSAADDAMRATIWERLPNAATFKAKQIDAGPHGAEWLCAWHERMDRLPLPHDAAGMVRIAREQHRYMREVFPLGPARSGGRILLAELAQGACSFRVAGDLSDDSTEG